MTSESPCQKTGPDLFKDVRGWLELHFHFDEPSDSSICALWVKLTRVYPRLPRVFHLFVAGAPGSGKTQLLNALASLGKGTVLGNVSAAAMARELGRGREVKLESGPESGLQKWSGDAYYHSACFDEFTGAGAEDRRAELAEMIRHAYARNGAPYTRWEVESNKSRSWNLYMPMAMAITGTVDPALASRGFRICAVKYKGPGDWGILMANRYPKGAQELGRRLDEWADAVRTDFKAEQIEDLEKSPEHKRRVEAVVENAGLDRQTEHALTVATVSYLGGIDITDELKRGMASLYIGSEEDEELVEEINGALLAVAKRTVSISPPTSISVKQSEVRSYINEAREAHHLKPLGHRRFAEGYRAAGIHDSWIRNRGNKNYWVIPTGHLELLGGLGNIPHSPNLPDLLDQQNDKVGRVDQVGSVGRLWEDFEKGLPYEELIAKYGEDLVEREKIPKIGGRA